MSSAGYNGWGDAPEEEREGAEPFERDAGTTGETPVARTELPMSPAETSPPQGRRRSDDRAA